MGQQVHPSLFRHSHSGSGVERPSCVRKELELLDSIKCFANCCADGCGISEWAASGSIGKSILLLRLQPLLIWSVLPVSGSALNGGDDFLQLNLGSD